MAHLVLKQSLELSVENQMNAHQTLAVTVRLGTIWLFLYVINSIAGAYFAAQHSVRPIPFAAVLVGAGAATVVCGVLWKFPLLVAKGVLPKPLSEAQVPSTFENWFSVGCSLIGVLTLAKAIPALLSYLLLNIMGSRMFPESFAMTSDWPLQIAYNVFQLCVGLWLFFGAAGLKKILLWVRTA